MLDNRDVSLRVLLNFALLRGLGTTRLDQRGDSTRVEGREKLGNESHNLGMPAYG
jgi:hypothetical protein